MTKIKTVHNKDYVKNFLKTLNNFCTKCPLDIKVIYVPENTTVYIKYDDKTINVKIDITKDKKEVIASLKEKLMKNYPFIYVKEEKIHTSDEVEALLAQGETLENALKPYDLMVKKYMVIRKHDIYNELDCKDIENDELCKFKCKIPVSIVMKKIKNKDITVIDDLKFIHCMENKIE